MNLAALIVAHCPDGAEFRSLGEVGTFVRGNGIQKKDLRGQGTPAIHYGQIFTHYGTVAHETRSFVESTLAGRSRKASPGDLVIATTSENDADVCRAVAWLGEEAAAVSSDAYVYQHRLNPKYVAYFFQSDLFQQQKARHITGTKVRRVSGTAMARFRIPVPPQAVQVAIAETLSRLETLAAEIEAGLGAEVLARRQQYAYYADALLASDEDVPRVRLGDLAVIVRGASPRPIQAFFCGADEGVPWIKIGDVPADGKYVTGTAQHVTPAGAAKSRRVRPGDFVLSNSMSFGRPYISKIDGYIHDGWLAISDFHTSFDADYLYYLLRSRQVQDEFAKRAGSGTVQNLNADIVRSIQVPVPARERQQYVVATLDKLDALVKALTSDLARKAARAVGNTSTSGTSCSPSRRSETGRQLHERFRGTGRPRNGTEVRAAGRER